MTVEEVTELLAGDDEDSATPGDVMAFASPIELKRSAFRALRRLGEGPLMAVDHAMRLQLNGRSVAFTAGAGPVEPLARAGRVLSADNERCLRDAHDHMETARGLVRSVIDQNVDADPEKDDGDEEARALRARQADAIRIKSSL